jgi:hypothetical protein
MLNSSQKKKWFDNSSRFINETEQNKARMIGHV